MTERIKAYLGICPRSLYDDSQISAYLVEPNKLNWATNLLSDNQHSMNPTQIRHIARVSRDLSGDRTSEVVSFLSNHQIGEQHVHNGQIYSVVQRMGNPSSMNDVVDALDAGRVFEKEKPHIEKAQANIRKKMQLRRDSNNVSAGLAQLDRTQNEIRSRMQSWWQSKDRAEYCKMGLAFAHIEQEWYTHIDSSQLDVWSRYFSIYMQFDFRSWL